MRANARKSLECLHVSTRLKKGAHLDHGETKRRPGSFQCAMNSSTQSQLDRVLLTCTRKRESPSAIQPYCPRGRSTSIRGSRIVRSIGWPSPISFGSIAVLGSRTYETALGIPTTKPTPPLPHSELTALKPRGKSLRRELIVRVKAVESSAYAVSISIEGSGMARCVADRMFIDLQQELPIGRLIPRNNRPIRNVLLHLEPIPAKRRGKGADGCDWLAGIVRDWHLNSPD